MNWHDEEMHELGYRYRCAGKYARTAVEGNELQKRMHKDKDAEAPELVLLRGPVQLLDAVARSVLRRT